MSQSASSVAADSRSSGRRRFTWPWLRPIVEWFFCYPPLFLETAALLLIVLGVQWDVLGADQIGLPGLFWHHSIWIQLTAGFGIAAVLGEVCLVGYLLDAEQKWMQRGRELVEDGAAGRTSWWYFFVTLTYPLLMLVAALPAAFAIELRWALPVGLLAGGLIVLALTRLGRSISPEKTGLFDWMLNLPKIRERLPEEWREELAGRRVVLRLSREERGELSPYFHLHAFQVFVSLALLAIYLMLYLAAAYWSAEFVSPALVICVLLALMTAAYGFIVFHFPERHFGVIFLIFAGYFCAGSYLAKQYQFDGLNYDQPTVLAEIDADERTPSGLIPNDEALDNWLRQRKTSLGGRKPVLVVVTTKGGGARAAAWTTAVLTRLEEDIPQLPYHTRLVSGVSGGMLGAMYYVATLNPPEPGRPLHTIPGDQSSSHDPAEIVDRISRDNLSPVVRHLALPLAGDRGEALEQAWEKNTAGVLARPFADMRDAEHSGWCPSLVFSPMLVEDGRRLIISNLDLGFLVRNQGSLLSADNAPCAPSQLAEYSKSGWQFFKLFPYATKVRLSTVARMNASFPYISPDAELATSPPRRVVDAAYYDAYGVNLAALWIHYCRVWLRENTAGVVLIQIRDQTRNFDPPSYMPPWQRAVSRFTTPLEGAIRARDATMSFRNDEMVHIVGEDLGQPGDPDFFTTAIFEYPGDAPFSWYLPPEDLEGMKKAVADPSGKVAAGARQLKDWWERREGAMNVQRPTSNVQR